MDMFNHYYYEDEVDAADFQARADDEERFLEESELKWAVTDFCTQVQKHGILEMGRLVLEELKKRGYHG